MTHYCASYSNLICIDIKQNNIAGAVREFIKYIYFIFTKKKRHTNFIFYYYIRVMRSSVINTRRRREHCVQQTPDTHTQ